MTYSLIVSILFRIINVLILVAVAMYGYKKYLKKTLVDDMVRKQHEREILEHGLRDTQKECRVRTQQLADDAELIAALTKKVILWRQAQHAVLMQREHYKRQHIDYFKTQAPIKQQRIAEYMAERAGIEDIIEQSRTILTDQFSDYETVRAYTDKALAIFKESELHERR